MTIEEILNLSPEYINTRNTKELKALTSKLNSAANKRIKRLKQSGLAEHAPSLKKLEKQGIEKFSVAGKNRNQTLNTFTNVQNFLNLKTSSITGYKEVIKNVEERIGVMDVDTSKKFWSIYRNLEEQNYGVFNSLRDSDQIQRSLYQEVRQGKSTEQIHQEMIQKINDMYIEMLEQDTFSNTYDEEEEEDDVFSFNDFF